MLTKEVVRKYSTPCSPEPEPSLSRSACCSMKRGRRLRAALGAERHYIAMNRIPRVMDGVVELVESLLHRRVAADLRSHRNAVAVGCHDEVAMVRRIDERAGGSASAALAPRAQGETLPQPRRGQVVSLSTGGPCDGYLMQAATGTRFPQGGRGSRDRVSKPSLLARLYQPDSCGIPIGCPASPVAVSTGVIVAESRSISHMTEESVETESPRNPGTSRRSRAGPKD